MDDFARLFGNDRDFVRCPFPAYARMRATAPVWFEPSSGVFVVSRYNEQRAVLADPATFSSQYMVGPRIAAQLTAMSARLREDKLRHLAMLSSLNTMDGARHDRLRRLAAKAFSPAAVSRLEPFIKTRCAQLANRILHYEPVEFVSAFAGPLAVEVIAEALGVRGADYAFFRWCTRCVTELTSGRPLDEAVLDEYLVGMAEFSVFFRRRFELLRERPDGSPLARLVGPSEDGQSLSDDELLGLCLTFVVAGTESTRNLLTSAVMRLAHDRDLLSLCRMCPDAIPVAVEEFVRLESPFQGFFRTALVDTEVGGVQVPSGSHLLLLFGSANRDKAVFDDAGTLNLARPSSRIHLGFGHGTHFCLGATLARTEVRIALETLVERYSRIELYGRAEEINYGDHLISRGPVELNVRFGGPGWKSANGH